MGNRYRPAAADDLAASTEPERGVAGGPAQKENPRVTYTAPARGRPATLDRGSSRRTPVIRSRPAHDKSDPPPLPQDARHPTPAELSATARRALTFRSMSDEEPDLVVLAVIAVALRRRVGAVGRGGRRVR